MGANGTFTAEVRAERGRRCDFRLHLTDAKGAPLPITPDHFPYTVGMSITNPPLPHHIGIATAENKPLWFFQRGQALPARQRQTCRTTTALRRGAPASDAGTLRIPVIEGTNGARADRNGLIGPLQVLPTDPRITRDVPVGSEIEITIEVDASRITRVTAFVPLIDATFEGVFSPRLQTRTAAELKADLDRERARLRRLEVALSDDPKARVVVERIRDQQLVEQIERLLAAADQDPDARAGADRKLLALMSAVDELEARLEWPTEAADARDALRQTSESLLVGGTEQERQTFQRLEAEITPAIREGRREVVRVRMEEVRALRRAVDYRQPAYWLGFLKYLEQRRESMTNPAAAHRLFLTARRMVDAGDMDGLRSVLLQLHALLPPAETREAPRSGGFGGTVVPE